MGAYRRGEVWAIRVPTRAGQIVRTTGTGHKATVRRMEQMLEQLGPKGRRDWELLDAVRDNRITVGELYDAWAASSLDSVRAQLRDVDLTEYLADWTKDVASRTSTTGGTAQRYLTHVRTLMPQDRPFMRSELTVERIAKWLANVPGSADTRRRYHAALSSFCSYLKGIARVLPANPTHDVQAPPASAPRRRYLEHEDVVALVEAQPEPYRTISALLHGSGIEISVALGLRRRDVDEESKEVHAAGTKTKARDRIAIVEDWAWEYLERHMAFKTPNALLFDNVNRHTTSDVHRRACKVLSIEDYRLHDARHTFAVRAIRAGAPFEVVAAQLGHADTQMVVRVYGRFKPSATERHDWLRVAAAQDAARAERRKNEKAS